MIVQATNNTAGTLSYSALGVSIGAGNTVTVPLGLLNPAAFDPNVLKDIADDKLRLGDSVNTYQGDAAVQYLKYVLTGLPLYVSSAFLYYSAPINVRQTAATASGATVWAMRNPAASTKTVYIERIEMLLGFDMGTPIGRSLQRYDLVRFSAATPSAGSAITVVPADSSASASAVTSVRFLDTGLTTTSVVFENPMATISCPATDQTTTKYKRFVPIKLSAGEGLCFRLNVAAVNGQSMAGEIIWSER